MLYLPCQGCLVSCVNNCNEIHLQFFFSEVTRITDFNIIFCMYLSSLFLSLFSSRLRDPPVKGPYIPPSLSPPCLLVSSALHPPQHVLFFPKSLAVSASRTHLTCLLSVPLPAFHLFCTVLLSSSPPSPSFSSIYFPLPVSPSFSTSPATHALSLVPPRFVVPSARVACGRLRVG